MTKIKFLSAFKMFYKFHGSHKTKQDSIYINDKGNRIKSLAVQKISKSQRQTTEEGNRDSTKQLENKLQNGHSNSLYINNSF